MSYIEIGEKFKNVTRDMRKFERRQKRFSPVREHRDGKKKSILPRAPIPITSN